MERSTERTARHLSAVNPTLAARMMRVLAAMEALGYPMVVYEGQRTTERQQALYAQGRTAVGLRVTNCDGVVKRSRHQDGAAVDAAFRVGTDEAWSLSWDRRQPWAVYGAACEALGLRWGGRWADNPHAELL